MLVLYLHSSSPPVYIVQFISDAPPPPTHTHIHTHLLGNPHHQIRPQSHNIICKQRLSIHHYSLYTEGVLRGEVIISLL